MSQYFRKYFALICCVFVGFFAFISCEPAPEPKAPEKPVGHWQTMISDGIKISFLLKPILHRVGKKPQYSAENAVLSSIS